MNEGSHQAERGEPPESVQCTELLAADWWRRRRSLFTFGSAKITECIAWHVSRALLLEVGDFEGKRKRSRSGLFSGRKVFRWISVSRFMSAQASFATLWVYPMDAVALNVCLGINRLDSGKPLENVSLGKESLERS
uniref:Uncharacterized protein n=1 Tax=Steinernema glaseri TaxID=37863 RepID=A0A1I8A3I9_9BILA